MIESRITITELESSKAASREELKRPDPSDSAAAEIIARNTIRSNKKDGINENPKKSD